MYDHDIEARIRSGSQLTTGGIVVLIMAFLGTCVAAASTAGDPGTPAAARGFELGQSPLLMIAMTLGIALITFGQVRKSNARREAERRYLEANTRVDVVLDEEAKEGPFRGNMKEVEVLDPVVAELQDAERARNRSRGASFLAIGAVLMILPVFIIILARQGGSEGSPQRAVEDILAAFGFSLIPFGFGLYFAIKGLLLRSK